MDKKREGTWRAGDSLKVGLRWAADGKTLPLADPKQPSMYVSNFQATFTYSGRWSLIQLIKDNTADFSKFSGSTPIALQFNVPTVPQRTEMDTPEVPKEPKVETANIFLNFSIMLPPTETPTEKATEKTKVKLLAYPLFPVEAPPIGLLTKR